MNRFEEEVIARHLHRDDATDEAIGARALEKLAGPLPRQRHSIFEHLPSLLLNRDFAPAWPRLAALASIALVGCMVGLAAPSLPRSAAAQVQIAEIDGGALALDSEPVTGVRP
jgi:hypothetical protein